DGNFPLRLYLRFTDPQRLFGLEPVHWILTRVVGLIGVAAALQVLAQWSNYLKGSRHTLSENLVSLGGWSQFLVNNSAAILAVVMLVYLLFLNGRTREAADNESRNLADVGGTRRPTRGSSFDELVEQIEGQ